MTSQPIWAVTPDKIQEAVRRIVETTHPRKIILFGSYPRGDAQSDSDLDILVIEREVKDRFTEMVRLNGVLKGLIMAVDILVIGEKDCSRMVGNARQCLLCRKTRREGGL